MGSFLAALFTSVAAAGVALTASATPTRPMPTKSPVIVDAKGDVVRFYGVPMNLKPSDLKRYRYKVGHGSSEGIPYTFYTLQAEEGVKVKVQFHKGKLSSVTTSSPNAIGPRGVGVGSALSAVKAAWPEGSVSYGIIENESYVTFEAAEPGFMPNVDYYFDPKDMPPHAFDHFYDYAKPFVRVEVPEKIRVKTIGIFPREFPEETYDFLAMTNGPCVQEIKAIMRTACERMTPKRRYRGTLFASGQTFLFAPAGHPPCAGEGGQAGCVAVEGNMWIRPDYDAQCPRLYRLELVGRRNVLPRANPTYRIMVDEIVAYQELDGPPNEPANCTRPWRSK